ncbi:hypothetical protein FRB95_001778 [Tulasnella sp. JGI-2019a]|nr:hypothetical protein FRB93_000913 [Tulasnella sp. JGI-2019a]KAG9038366.1 hypothetical protein FRB95_001778 [Tulasnella sp. JGI-2019a]
MSTTSSAATGAVDPSVTKGDMANVGEPAATVGLVDQREPQRAATLGSQASGEDEAIVSMPFLSLFQNAAAYGDLMEEDDDSDEASSDHTSLSDTRLPRESPPPMSAADTEAADLIKETVAAKRAVSSPTSRLAQLAVNTWSAGNGLDGSAGSISQEPQEVPNADAAEKLAASNDRVIPLIVKEFGPLAEVGEEERLVAEADAAYFRQVAIIGLVHLTTHRITFHASLLQTRQEEHPDNPVIKSGRVIVHRDGLHRKKRVWLELTHDMISTFPDSTDEGRVRPLRTILLSAVKNVQPLDEAEPNSMRMCFDTAWGQKHGHVEFDNPESAASWRRELNGALHEYRVRRQAIMDPASALAQQHGVRFSIPLDRIGSFDTRTWASFATVITFNLTPPKGEASVPPTPGNLETIKEESENNTSAAPTLTSLTLSIIQGFDPAFLRNRIDIAKARRIERPSTIEHSDEVTVDFGELSLVENFEEPHQADAPPAGNENTEVLELGQREFGLLRDEKVWHAKCAIVKVTRSTGHLLISPRFVCFFSKGLVANTKLRFAAQDVNIAIASEKECIMHFHRLILQVKGQPEIVLHFRSSARRNKAVQEINDVAAAAKLKLSRHASSASLSEGSTYFGTPDSSEGRPSVSSDGTAAEPTPLKRASSMAESITEELAPIETILQRSKTRVIPKELLSQMPRAINIPRTSVLHTEKQHFACLTIGSRGDVQPYIALALGLLKEGHEVTIVTHEEYKGWIEGFGIKHRTAGGDPGALMKLSVEHKMFSPAFFKESLGHFRTWVDELLRDSFIQVKESGATVLIESPSAMAGLHIAEALDIPYFRAFTMPWSRTEEYPHAFISPPDMLQGSFNYSTYVLFDNVFWRALAPQVNRWRKKQLGLPKTDLEKMAQTKIPFLYNFSPQVVPKPLDWSDTTLVTGYWFLDNPDPDWSPPTSLLEFMATARADGKPLVYIGFGSIVVENPKAMTRSIIKAVLKSDVRAILNKGWSARMAVATNEPEVELPAQIYSVDKIPHDWLFPQIDAALHHGGAGTTGASLRAGIPTLIKPWFGDQFFWASRVQKLGAGIKVATLHSSEIAHALTKATSSRIIKEKAQAVGERIRGENGVQTAIQSLYMYLHRAGVRTAIKPSYSRSLSHAASHNAGSTRNQGGVDDPFTSFSPPGNHDLKMSASIC